MARLELAKLIGSADTKTWAQVHVFTPEDGEKRERYGSLLAAFSLKSREQAESGQVEIAAFGKELIVRFHELYYTGETHLAVHERLEQAFRTIRQEYEEQVDLSGVAAVILEPMGKTALYVTRLGQAQAFLWRQGQLNRLVGSDPGTGLGSLSGLLEAGDAFLLGTDQVFELVPLGSLTAALGQPTLDQTSQILTPILHGHQENSLTALVLGRSQREEPEAVEPETAVTSVSPVLTQAEESRLPPSFPGSRWGAAREAAGRFWQQATAHFKGGWLSLRSRALEHRSIAIRESGQRRPKKMAISVALVFLLLLGVSVVIGLRQKRSVTLDRQGSEALTTVGYSLEQAKQLAELNPGRAKSLLVEAQDALDKYQTGQTESTPEVDRLKQEITEWLARVSREYRFDQADVFFDLSLIKEDFKAKRWGVTDHEVVLLGKDAVATLSLDKKQSAVIAGGEDVAGAELVGSVSPWGVVATSDQLLVVDKAEERVIDTQPLKEIRPTDLVGYAGNVYVLASSQDQVWRFAGLADGLAQAQAYMKGEPKLGEAVGLAIDGSLWILFRDGSIVKYTRGVQDAFAVSGLDVSFAEPIRLFTDENQENLYILDRKNTRVIVISKTGEYQAQYVWPGMAGAVDVFASEAMGKIFLLTDNRIYSLDIRQ
jgi:hypothetical protein